MDKDRIDRDKINTDKTNTGKDDAERRKSGNAPEKDFENEPEFSDEELIEVKPNLELLMEQYLDGTLEIEDSDFDLDPIKENDFLDLLGISPEDKEEEISEKTDAEEEPEEEKTPHKPLYVEGDTNILFHDIDVADWPDPELVNNEDYFMQKAEEESRARANAARKEEEAGTAEETVMAERPTEGKQAAAEKTAEKDTAVAEEDSETEPNRETNPVPEEETGAEEHNHRMEILAGEANQDPEAETDRIEEPGPMAGMNPEEVPCPGGVADIKEIPGTEGETESGESTDAEAGPVPEEAPKPEENVTLQEEEPEEETGKGNSMEDGYMTDTEKKDEEANQQQEIDRQKNLQIKKEQNMLSEILSWVIPCMVAVAVVLLLKTFVIINARVPSGSMENTIMTGDNLVGYRLAYLNKDPERGDIVIFYYPDDESQKFIKRIIGLPGEKVRIEDGKVYINDSDTPLEEDYLKEEWVVATGPYEFEVPENCYLMLGDNRNNSKDSRYWTNTYVSRDKIIGKALFVYFPIRDWGTLN